MSRNIKLSFWGLLAGLTGLWLLANAPFSELSNFISVRNLLVNLSGVLGIGVMSVAMILALRPVWLEPWLGGLDKSYRLHKWLGIAALSTAIIHWLAVNAPKWMVGLGLMERPQRNGPPAGAVEEASVFSVQSFLGSQRELAEQVGEWAFYAAVIWIGAGIGITPIIARMKQLAGSRSANPVDLFHCVPQLATEARDKLVMDAAQANISLHVIVDSEDGLLTSEKIQQAVPDWRSSSVWFCGPAAFGTALCRDFTSAGLPRRAFHQELFNLR